MVLDVPEAFTIVHKNGPDWCQGRYWWRRRESNPRPQVLCHWLYMLIPVY